MQIPKQRLFFAKIGFILAASPLLLHGYSEGPDPGYTNAPGDNKTSCIASGCHSGTVNSGSGNVKILLPSGNSGTYAPGQSMQLLVQITDSTKSAYGFEMTARMGTANTTQAGTFSPVDNLTQTASSGPNQYIEHNGAGFTASLKKTPSFTYTVNWTPPATASGAVTFYVAANAGPGLPAVQTPTNVYTSTLTLNPGAPAGPPVISNVQDAESARATVVPGEWVAIYGSNFGSTTRIWGASDFNSNNLPSNLSGITVTFNGLPAAVYFISPGQIDVQVPAGITGTVPVVVSNSGTAGTAFDTTVAANAPSLFYYPAGTKLYPAATHLDGTLIGDPAVMANSKKVVPGETIVLYINGLASSPSGTIIQAPIAYSTPVTVTIGTTAITPSFVGLVAAGEYQVNMVVPSGLTSGDNPIAIATQGQASPGSIILPVQ
jgi:uncharacterized protein (TIGR03437 family)